MTDAADFHWMHVSRAAALVRSGEQGTVVIVPGAMADAQGWLPFAAALRTSMSVAIVNRRGCVPSENMPLNSTVLDEVEDVRKILLRLQGPFVLVGWSYGGLLAIEAAIGRADVASTILYELVCHPFAPNAAEPIRQTVEAGNLDQAVALVIMEVTGASEEQVTALRNSPAWAYLKPLAVPAATELSALNQFDPNFIAYAAIDAPVTSLIGSLNENKKPYGTAANRFVNALPNAAKIILAGQAHLAHIEEPVRLAEMVQSTISGQSKEQQSIW